MTSARDLSNRERRFSLSGEPARGLAASRRPFGDGRFSGSPDRWCATPPRRTALRLQAPLSKKPHKSTNYESVNFKSGLDSQNEIQLAPAREISFWRVNPSRRICHLGGGLV